MASLDQQPAATQPEDIAVLLVDNSRLARDALRAMLTTEKRLRLVGEMEDGEEALRWIGKLRPDVVVTDMQLGGVSGAELTRQVKEQWPEIRVVILTMDTDHEKSAHLAGADAYLLKGDPPATILRTLLGEG